MASNDEELKLEVPCESNNCEEECQCLAESDVAEVVQVKEETETVETELIVEEESKVDEQIEESEEESKVDEQIKESEEEQVVEEESETDEEDPDNVEGESESDDEQQIVVEKDLVVEPSIVATETVQEPVVVEEQQVVIDFAKENEQKPEKVVQPVVHTPQQQQRQPYISRILKPVGHHLKRFKFF